MIATIERKRAKKSLTPSPSVPDICTQLQELQRQRVCNLKSRIMVENRLVATVATAGGYRAGMEEKERGRRFDEARKTIERIKAEGTGENECIGGLVLSAYSAIEGFDRMVTGYEKAMEKLAKQLPVYAWLQQPEQRGFGLLSLAKIIGESGDLINYAAPGKLWKRMGCAPFGSNGKMLMPATWRRGAEGKLSSEEWEQCGYNPRRRSLAYLIGEGLVKQNQGGPYRARYDATKARCAESHPDYKPLRCHLHGMLLATKLLLKNLWIEWTGENSAETEKFAAGLETTRRR